MYVGHLVLWSVTSALLSANDNKTQKQRSQRRTVYESLFVEHENYRGRTREHVCLRLSPRSVFTNSASLCCFFSSLSSRRIGSGLGWVRVRVQRVCSTEGLIVSWL